VTDRLYNRYRADTDVNFKTAHRKYTNCNASFGLPVGRRTKSACSLQPILLYCAYRTSRVPGINSLNSADVPSNNKQTIKIQPHVYIRVQDFGTSAVQE